MPRPSRCRRVCCEPLVRLFAPQGGEELTPVVLLVEEYEAIRIVDLEKRTHDQCAQQMQISRTTATEIYEKARFTIGFVRKQTAAHAPDDADARPLLSQPRKMKFKEFRT